MADPILIIWLKAMRSDSPESSFSLTVGTSAGIFSGRAITASAYFSALGVRMADAFDRIGLDGGIFVSGFDQLAEDSQKSPDDPKFLYLKDVTAFSGGVKINLAYWRIDIEQVIGLDFAGLSPN